MKNVLLYPKPSQRDQNYWKDIVSTLSSYEEKTVLEKGNVKWETVHDNYFLVNDTWNVDRIGQIPNFKEQYEKYKVSKARSKNINFRVKNPSVNMEIKFVFYNQLFSDHWKLISALLSHNSMLKKLAEYLDEKHPNLTSLLDLDIEKEEKFWRFWLNSKGEKTRIIRKISGTEYENDAPLSTFLGMIHGTLFQLTDTRDEWEKDRWDVRALNQKYGIKYNESDTHYYIDFLNIDNKSFREPFKEYVKGRLIGGKKFSWSSAQNFLKNVPLFLNSISKQEPSWKNLKNLERKHIEKYLEELREYAKNNLKQRNSNPVHYVSYALTKVRVFLEDLQRYEKFEDFTPEKVVSRLIYPEDFPTLPKKADDDIDHIPEHVLEQLFKAENFNDLHLEVQPVILVAFKTGLRISDALGLTHDCLIRLNGKYSIQTDLEKTYTKGHKIPIDDELANMVAVLIDQSVQISNKDNNPNNYIFARYSGSRKGKPYSQHWVRDRLNNLARAKNITDETGTLFHFGIHQFRHTYAVKMLNGGADILVVQQLLGHASPEMTLRYARLLDDTKRKAFEQVVNNGAFTFDLNGQLTEVKENEDAPENILEMLWQDHKLTAIENPYGTCRARVNGDCPIAKNPPCLTANDGKPCYDLFVDNSDVAKYELYVKNTKNIVKEAQERGLQEIAEINETNLKRYEDILGVIKSDGVVFGRLERMKRQQEGKGKRNKKKGDKVV